MNRISMSATLLVAGFVFSASGHSATAVSLPANVVTDRANVSTDFAAVAAARSKLVSDVAAGNSTAFQADVSAYETARAKLDADMQRLRADAQAILQQDEAILNDDRIMIEIYNLTNNSTYATVPAQFTADLAQAQANREAIFGNLCPAGAVVCEEGPGRRPGTGRGLGVFGRGH